MEEKKFVLLRVLDILKRYTDAEHPLKQEEIAQKLREEYGLSIERKAIGRDLVLLREAGYDIHSRHSGSYLAERTFEDSELRLLIDGVLSSRYMTARHSRDLINKLIAQSSEYFKAGLQHVRSVNAWSKTENSTVFYNIDVLDGALRKKKRVRFQYNKYGTDKRLHPSARHEISVVQLLLHNQRYYVMAFEEHWQNVCFFRIDRITEIETLDVPATPVRDIPGCRGGIDYAALARMPYMFSDPPERVEMIAKADIVDQIVDWLGTGIEISKLEGGRIRVACRVSPTAMEYWAMQYLNFVEIVAPVSLRERIAANLAAAQFKYSADPLAEEAPEEPNAKQAQAETAGEPTEAVPAAETASEASVGPADEAQAEEPVEAPSEQTSEAADTDAHD